MMGRAFLAWRSYLGRSTLVPATPSPGVTCRSVVHSPCGSTCTAKRQAVLVDRARLAVAEIQVSRT